MKKSSGDNKKITIVAFGLSPGWTGPRGVLARKMYTPARTAARNPYPQWYNTTGDIPI